MTIIAAVVFTALWAKMRKESLLTTTLMFWAAALMWSVDGVASVLDGEPFFDISREDTVLGAIIILCGLAVFAVLAVFERRRELRAN
jgi:Zn-dependent protease with chaperone function